MNKPFKTYDEQLEILINRGLIISDLSKAKYLLSQFNYYNLINGYKKPFLINDTFEDDKYRSGSTFEEIYSLHELDRKLKNVVFPSILRFEKLLKTSISYHFSEKYRSDLYPYLQIENYSKEKHQFSYVLNNISTLANTINREHNKSNGKTSIKHYIKNHDNVPLWVLVNFLTLGNISYFYSALEESLQNTIAKDFGIRFKLNYNSKEKISKTELIEIIKICNYFRNVCAHDEVLYSFNLKKIGQTAIFDKFFEESYTGKNFHDLLLVLKLVLDKPDYDELISSIFSIKESFKDNFNSISIDAIFSIMGF